MAARPAEKSDLGDRESITRISPSFECKDIGFHEATEIPKVRILVHPEPLPVT